MDKLTNEMSQAEYIRYSQARQYTFNNNNKFRDWLMRTDRHQSIKIHSYAMEVFQYLARETIAQVNLCFGAHEV